MSENKMFTFFLPSVRRMSDCETIRPIEQLVIMYGFSKLRKLDDSRSEPIS